MVKVISGIGEKESASCHLVFGYIVALLTILMFSLVLVPAVWASSYLPFAGKQILLLPGAKSDYHLYKNGNSGYMAVTYQTGFVTGDRDILVQILNKEGKLTDQQVYERPGNDNLLLVHQASKGLILAVSNQQENGKDIYLIRIDSQGKQEWTKKYPGDGLSSIASTNDDGLIVAGYKQSASGKDLYVLKLDKNGRSNSPDGRDASCWQASYGKEGNQEARYITQVLDKDKYNDGYILTGYSEMSDGNKDVILVRLDAYGKQKWNKTYGGNKDDEGLFAIPIYYENNDELAGFFTAGYTCSQGSGSDKDMYFLYTDPYGYKKHWEGRERAIDGLPEKIYGGSKDEIAYAIYEVPKDFEDNRMLQGKDIEGYGGFVLMGIREDSRNSELILIRIDDRGKDLWKKNIELKGAHLIPAELQEDSGKVLNLAYSYAFPEPGDTTMDFHTLRHYLWGVIDEDKTVPQDDQKETNREIVTWETITLKYAGYRDKGKEIREIMAGEKVPVLHKSVSGYGKGEIVWPDTSYYWGKVYLGKADGWGTLVFPDGMWYEGEWKNNMFNGTGTMFFPTGECYKGSFKDHTMFGQGVFTWPTGELYEGELAFNKRHGQGTFFWPGGIKYVGGFEKDKANGMGKIIWPNGERYEGQMKDGQPNGRGSYYFPNGEWYRGEFSGLTFTGIGAYHWPDGSLYAGEFKGDRFYGQGNYVWPNGVQQWGYWKDDRYMGIHPESME